MHFRLVASMLLCLSVAGSGCRRSSQDRAESGEDSAAETAVTKPWDIDTKVDHGGGFVSYAIRQSEEQAGRFVRLPASDTGVHLINAVNNNHPLAHLYVTATFAGGGVCIGDFDDDGWPDLFLSSQTGRNALYRQTARWKFEDVSESAGLLDEQAWSSGAVFADLSGDGRLDLLVCNYQSPNRFYVNQGDGTFQEQAEKYGLAYVVASLMASPSDYDNDGDLDLYLLTNRTYPLPGENPRPNIKNIGGAPVVQHDSKDLVYAFKAGDRWKIVEAGQRDFLLRNDGGKFVDATTSAGIDAEAHFHGLSATWWDSDDDGDLDLYVANDFYDPDHFYRNNGDGSFTDIIRDAVPHTPWFSMGSDAGDLNGDGLADFLVADMSATTHVEQKVMMGSMDANNWFLKTANPPQYMRNALYLNSGAGRFQEAAYLAELDSTDWTWSVKFGDLDNDGRLDVVFTNGTVRRLMDADLNGRLSRLHETIFPGRDLKSLSPEENQQLVTARWKAAANTPTRREADLAYRNLGDLKFRRESEWGLEDESISYGAALADIDRDGDLDLVINRVGEAPGVYRNDAAVGNSLVVKLVGSLSNKSGLGAKVTIETASGGQVRWLTPVSGYQSANEPLLHFGLGDAKTVKAVEVKWPSGLTQTLKDVAANRFIVVHEEGEPSDSTPVHAKPLLTKVTLPEELRHRETPFDDYAVQPLLPQKYSQLGPGMAWGDVDGDGDDDLYCGGAKGQAGQLWLNEDGELARQDTLQLGLDAEYEDMQPLFFDADSDGDLDLLVTSGGVEVGADSPLLFDRLYLNDGTGQFERAADALPDAAISSGPAAAADFDRDGDLDLFIGGRIVPGKYPHSPRSRLLRNEAGRFEEVTAKLSPELPLAGMVSGAVWSDANADGWPDLLLACEWGPVRYFENDEGNLVEQTDRAGLSGLLGWWNGVSPIDLNGDAAMDYVVTNVGLNTKYHADEGHPALLVYGDLDGSGSLRLVEAKYEDDCLVPIRGRSCSSRAMPFIGEKFPTYREFGLASLDEIYTPQRLDQAGTLQATEFRSGVLINVGQDGQAKFEFRPLPRLAQIAPGYGAAVCDFNADGISDVLLAQNSFSPQVETGRMDGGLGLLMLGDGQGNLLPVRAGDSGVVVSGDGKSATVGSLDSRPMALIGRNDAAAAGLQPLTDSGQRQAVRLIGPRGNPTGVGARVVARYQGGATRFFETTAGAGYLSQSSTKLWLGNPQKTPMTEIEVHWPDGQTSKQRPSAGQMTITAPRQE